MNHQDNLARISSAYGVQSTDSFDGDITEYHRRERDLVGLDWFLENGGRFERIRLLTERGYPYMDVSYVYGVMPNGEDVRLRDGDLNPSHSLGRRTYRSQICQTIKDAGGNRAQAQQAWDTEVYAILWG